MNKTVFCGLVNGNPVYGYTVKNVEELAEVAKDYGYELRRKGHKVEKHNVLTAGGEEVRNCYMPHLAISASTLARTWKLLKEAAKLFGYTGKPFGIVWAKVLLLALEHIVRWLKHEIKDDEMQRSIQRLVKPLPKAEYLNRKGKK